jgi:hypothetical protein
MITRKIFAAIHVSILVGGMVAPSAATLPAQAAAPVPQSRQVLLAQTVAAEFEDFDRRGTDSDADLPDPQLLVQVVYAGLIAWIITLIRQGVKK